MFKLAARIMATVVATVLLGALLCGTLVRFAPGFGSDENDVNAQLSEESIAALRAEREKEGGLIAFYSRFLTGYFTGDLGTSRTLNQPVRQLLAERMRPTLYVAGVGLAGGWLLALGVAVMAAMAPSVGRPVMAAFTGTLLAVPVGLLALAFLVAGSGSVKAASLVVACVVFPRLARYLDQMLQAAAELPHVLTARARGVGEWGLFARHVAPCCKAEAAALAGVSLSFALSAAIPAEVILDVAGVGQLAWQAALGRDLPLLVNVTVLITLVVVSANTIAEQAGRRG